MVIMPKAFPIEFRRGVFAVARKGEAPLSQVAKDLRDLRVPACTVGSSWQTSTTPSDRA
jgi:hypothetical protein